MNVAYRRIEIINLLNVRRHTTTKELAMKFDVSPRTIEYDIQALSTYYPIYTLQGENGGIFIRDDYKPYINTLTPDELRTLFEMYDLVEEQHMKEVLYQLICKYGPDKMKF